MISSLQSALFLLPLLPSLGAGEPQSGVNIPVSDEEIFPLVRDLVRAVDPRGVGIIHHSCTVTESRLHLAKYSGLLPALRPPTLSEISHFM